MTARLSTHNVASIRAFDAEGVRRLGRVAVKGRRANPIGLDSEPLGSDGTTAVIRADATAEIGTGHVMRCVALGQALRTAGWGVVFAARAISPHLEQRVRDERFRVVHLDAQPGSDDDATQTRELASGEHAAWIVLDGYVFDGQYQERLAGQSQRVLLVDDAGGADRYQAAVILNQNLHARESLYASRAPGALLLLGPRYALLRREFTAHRSHSRDLKAVGRRVLVTLGGADPDNVTSTVIAGLRMLDQPGFELTVVAGGSNRHGKVLEAAIRSAPFPVSLQSDTKDMRQLMDWADLAVAAAGTTSWELAFMGVPALLLVLAENQQPIAVSLDGAGAAINLGRGPDVSAEAIASAVAGILRDPERMSRMAERGQSLVDGQGASRVVQAILQTSR